MERFLVRQFNSTIQLGICLRQRQAFRERCPVDIELPLSQFAIVRSGVQTNTADAAGHGMHLVPDGKP